MDTMSNEPSEGYKTTKKYDRLMVEVARMNKAQTTALFDYVDELRMKIQVLEGTVFDRDTRIRNMSVRIGEMDTKIREHNEWADSHGGEPRVEVDDIPPSINKLAQHAISYKTLPRTPEAFEPEHPKQPVVENDCEDQGFSSTKVCTKFECQEWRRGETSPWHPPLVLKDGYWCCLKCGASYGVNPHPDCPPPPKRVGLRIAWTSNITKLLTTGGKDRYFMDVSYICVCPIVSPTPYRIVRKDGTVPKATAIAVQSRDTHVCVNFEQIELMEGDGLRLVDLYLEVPYTTNTDETPFASSPSGDAGGLSDI